MKKVWPIFFILLGLALLIGAATFWADTLSMDVPPSLGETLRDWLTTLAGLGSSLAGWMALLKPKPEKSQEAASRTVVMDEGQAATGPNSRAIRTEGDYYEGGTHIHLQPEIPQPHDTIGFIPAAQAVTYIHRGQIEEDVRAFLEKGNGAGAIVGLHAPGGLGKTELAKHAAGELKGQFEDVLWVDVGEKTPPQVVGEMLIKCGVQLPPGSSYEQQRNELHSRLLGCKWLVILDDVRQKALEGLADFLPPRPCATLITSRIQQVRGANKTFELDHMTPEQAHALMEAILGAEVVTAEKEAAEKLAARCAFNPLALEIAARRIRQLQGIRTPIARYFEIAQARFSELKMDGDARWDMEKVFDISYLDLSADDRARFRALAAFHPTGFAPQAAAAVWGVDLPEARGTLSRFINLSLVKVVAGDFERYRLHDLLDEYAGKKLHEDRAEEIEKRNALAEWVAGEFDDNGVPNDDNIPRLTLEKENLILSAQWAMQQQDGWRLGRLATTPANWLGVNFFAETWRLWKDWLTSALQYGIVHDDKKQASRLKANCIQALGDVHRDLSELPEARARYEEALPLYRSIGAKLGEANVYASQGQLYLPDNSDRANELLNQAIQIYQSIGDQYSIPAQIGNFGWRLLRLGEKEKAKPYLLQAADLFEKIGLMDYAERHRNAASG